MVRPSSYACSTGVQSYARKSVPCYADASLWHLTCPLQVDTSAEHVGRHGSWPCKDFLRGRPLREGVRLTGIGSHGTGTPDGGDQGTQLCWLHRTLTGGDIRPISWTVDVDRGGEGVQPGAYDPCLPLCSGVGSGLAWRRTGALHSGVRYLSSLGGYTGYGWSSVAVHSSSCVTARAGTGQTSG